LKTIQLMSAAAIGPKLLVMQHFLETSYRQILVTAGAGQAAAVVG
jgi:hypothetical protein